MRKELRNEANRRSNCDQANIDKALAASEKQTAAIRQLRDDGRFDIMPEKLKEIAELRLENPDATLVELGEMLDPPLKKAGVNSRLKRIMAIGITFLEKYEPLPRNTLCLFDRFGNRVLTYAKVHTCDFGDECRLTAGDDFYVADLNTEQGNVKIGAMICYDREFPESARILMLKGAEIILVPNACTRRSYG